MLVIRRAQPRDFLATRRTACAEDIVGNAGTIIACQPQLGASLRKGWFRMIGTVVGAVMA
jgi:hypothetical protein